MRAAPPRVTLPSHWLFGPAYYVRRRPLHWISKWIAEYGDIFTIKSLFGQATIIADPELARRVLVDNYLKYQEKSLAYHVLRILMGNGLVTSHGEGWRRQRKLVQPAFHRRRLDALFSMMVERVTACAEQIESIAATGGTADVGPIFSQLTLDIIARAMFSTDVRGSAADVSRHIATLNEDALHMLRRPWLFLLPRRVPTPFNIRLFRSLTALNSTVQEIIKARRAQPEAHDDLLSMLLSASEESTGLGMSDEQLRDEVMTIFVAGHETTANAMCWLVYLVSQHPAVEEQLVAEIDNHWPHDGLNAINLGTFTYLRQVIEESLRMYPTIWAVGRRCTEEEELGGYRIPVGMNVAIPIFHFHWSNQFWNEPEKFDPSRFSPERRPAPDAMFYLPFGAGPRSCIGNHFALQELMIMTLIFYRRFHFELQPGFAVEPDPLITLRPRSGMMMAPERRVSGLSD